MTDGLELKCLSKIDFLKNTNHFYLFNSISKMKKFFFLILNCFFSNILFAQSNGWSWAKQIGGTGNDLGFTIAIDHSGNIYSTGRFEATADFDPDSIAAFNLTSGGGSDIYVSKYDNMGNFIWAKSFEGVGADGSNSISLDDSGNIYITGWFQGVIDFDPGVGSYYLTPTAASPDIFILKLDASGNLIWVKSMGSTHNDFGTSIMIDSFGYVVITGYFQDTIDFNPDSIGIFNLYANIASNDIFILKLNNSGDFIWANSIGGALNDIAGYIATDDSGNIFITGYFEGGMDFNPDSLINFYLNSFGNSDIFISKFDSAGNFIWAKQIGGAGIESITSIKFDLNGNIYTTGCFSSSTDFDPDTSVNFNLTSNGNKDIYILKLDNSGAFIWVKAIGGINDETGSCLSLDSAENIYVTGWYEGLVDFNPGSGVFNINSVGNIDMYLLKFDNSGNFKWVKSAGGSGAEQGISIGFDMDNNLILSGNYFSPSIAIGATTLINSNNSGSDADIFFASLNVNSLDSCSAYFLLYPDTSQLHNWFAIAFVTGDTPYSYLWNWGDGNTSSGATPSHTYSTPDYYNICLTLTDGNGCTSVFCDSSTFISKTEESRMLITVNVVAQLPDQIPYVTALKKELKILPNPCTTCEIIGAEYSNELIISDLAGREIPVSFSKSSNGYFINFPEKINGALLIRNKKNGKVEMFVKE